MKGKVGEDDATEGEHSASALHQVIVRVRVGVVGQPLRPLPAAAITDWTLLVATRRGSEGRKEREAVALSTTVPDLYWGHS